MSRRKKENLENCLSGTFRGNEKGFGFVKLEGEDDENEIEEKEKLLKQYNIKEMR